MKFTQLQEKTRDLLLFDKQILITLEPRRNALDANIKYWLKKGWLISPKKGVYLSKKRYQAEPNKDKYLEYIANQLVKPSYVSLEYVLSKYQILSEAVRAITSVTLKTSREINGDLGAFRYYSLTRSLFLGYKIDYFNDASILIASKSKALFDYLYLRFLKELAPEQVVIENLRLNWENVSKKELVEAQAYLDLISSERLKNVFQIIQERYYA